MLPVPRRQCRSLHGPFDVLADGSVAIWKKQQIRLCFEIHFYSESEVYKILQFTNLLITGFVTTIILTFACLTYYFYFKSKLLQKQKKIE